MKYIENLDEEGIYTYTFEKDGVCWDATIINGNKQRKKLDGNLDVIESMRGTLYNLSVETLEGVDLGISGLGYNTKNYVLDSEKDPAIGGLFHSSNGDLYKTYEDLSKETDFTCTIAKATEGTFSGNLKGNIDLKASINALVDFIPEQYREMVKQYLATDSVSGKLNFDIFAAWASNYICQQEYIINVKDLKYSNPGTPAGDISVDVKNLNMYFGQEVSLEYDVTDDMINKIMHDYPEVQ